MPEIEVGRYCGGTGKPASVPDDRDSVVWTYYHCDDGACGGHWTACAVRKRTDRFVYVDPEPDQAGERSVRVDRQGLERDGEAWSRTERELYFTSATMERLCAAPEPLERRPLRIFTGD